MIRKLIQFFRTCRSTDTDLRPNCEAYYRRYLEETNTPHDRALRETFFFWFSVWELEEGFLNNPKKTS